ncbi:MAG: hypothetical protein GF383_00655 [Candidatus Lokiarchaeota archaeon]|nr:hypothetical protein [Candidatus Lokiarchaeota archaeon]MBD3337683.1 hypothetical protein [Candidatus Lokiarchaeota archaeon]
MNSMERIFTTISGSEPDEVPTMSILYDLHPIYQVIGYPKKTDADLINSRYGQFFLKKFGMSKIGNLIAKKSVKNTARLGVEAAVELGFDAAWSILGLAFSHFPDEDTIMDDWGSYNDIIFDSHGNATYYWRKPMIKSPEDYENWEFFPDEEKSAKQAYKFYKKLVSDFGKNICIFGDVYGGLFQTMFTSMGLEKIAYYMRKKPDFIKDFVKRLESFSIETIMAMMDAGVKVIMKGDDMSFKSGPQINPKLLDKFWGPSYTKLCEAIHERGGLAILHSCGDNTKLFDLFIKWGFDGAHAFEPTSNVDIFKEKEKHGNNLTIIGNLDVDYTLTERSKPEEVIEETKKLIKHIAPGGRFILAPTHSHPEIDIEKEKIMINAVQKYGKYPINL